MLVRGDAQNPSLCLGASSRSWRHRKLREAKVGLARRAMVSKVWSQPHDRNVLFLVPRDGIFHELVLALVHRIATLRDLHPKDTIISMLLRLLKKSVRMSRNSAVVVTAPSFLLFLLS